MTLPRVLLPCLLTLAACPKDAPDDATDASTSTTAPDTTTDPTTGPTAGPSSQLCQEACAHLEQCGGDSIYFMFGLSGCVSLCEHAAIQDTDFCRSSVVDLYTCLRDGTCEEVSGLPTGACAVANADYTISCAGCPAFVDGVEGDACTASADCVHSFVVDFMCEGDTCRCVYKSYEDEPDVEFASCPAAGVCAAGTEAIHAAAEACCDMPFVPYDLGP